MLTSRLLTDTNVESATRVRTRLVTVQLDLWQGESRRLFGRVDGFSNSGVGTEFSAEVECVDHAAPTTVIGYHGAAAKNYVPGGTTRLEPQTLFTAPATGTYDCFLEAYSLQSVVARAFATYLQLDTVDVGPEAGYWRAPPCDSPGTLATCQYLGAPTDGTPGTSQVYLLDATGIDPAHGWTAEPGASSVAAAATLGVTTCHHSASCLPKYHTGIDTATVNVRLEVIQHTADGGICHLTYEDVTSTIDYHVHHYGVALPPINHIPVLGLCNSRVFSARLRVRLLSGDDVKIDGTTPFTTTTGSVRTHAMIVNEGQPLTVYQATDNRVSTLSLGGVPFETLSFMAPGTRPAIARLATGGFEIAFVASDGVLWVQDAGIPGGSGRSTGLQLWPGTSPAIAADTHGGWMIAAQDKDSRLWTIDSAGNQIKTPSAMSPTSPAITHLATGGYKIAFNASDGHLWVQDAGIPGGSGHGTWLIPATSPAIAADNYGNWKIAIEGAGTYHLVTLDSAGTVTDTGAIMAANTSPSIAGLATGGYETAINAWDGFLWEVGDGGNRRTSNGLGVAPGTSPAIVAQPVIGFDIVFHAQGDHLWTVTSDHFGHDTGVLLSAGASPAAAA